jgi:hypothetical protein
MKTVVGTFIFDGNDFPREEEKEKKLNRGAVIEDDWFLAKEFQIFLQKNPFEFMSQRTIEE